jgi:tetratricopeptide (TPR) repeat protein
MTERAMEFTCPNCNNPLGDVPNERFRNSRAEIDCPACGIPVIVDRQSGEAHPATSTKADREARVSSKDLSVSEMAGVQPKDRDVLPVIVLIGAILAFIGGGYAVTKHIQSGALGKSTSSLSDIISGLAEDVKIFLEREGLLTQDKTRSAVPHLRRGYAYFEKNRLSNALEEFDRAVEIDPDNPDAYYWRARALTQAGRYDRAEKDLKKAVDLNPRFAAAYDTMGWLYMQQRQWDKGIAALDRSIELKPDNGWAYTNRGYMYRQKGDLKQALADAENACRRNYEEGCRLRREIQQDIDLPKQGSKRM